MSETPNAASGAHVDPAEDDENTAPAPAGDASTDEAPPDEGHDAPQAPATEDEGAENGG